MKTVKRAIDILTCFSHEEPEISIGELSRRLGVHKSIVSRLVAALCNKRMLEQDPRTRKVSIGVGAFRLGALFIKRMPLERIASGHLNSLVEKIQHSCYIAVLDAHRLLTIASAESRKSIRVILRTGEHRFLHATAGGKLLLALRPGLFEEVLDTTGLPAITARTFSSPTKLRKELVCIRENGIAWNFEESTRGGGACAAPIFDASGQIVGAVSVVYPLSAVSRSEFAAIGAKTREAGHIISAAMGWRSETPRNSKHPISVARILSKAKPRVHQVIEA